MHTLVLGGIRSGKSGWAEQLAGQLAGPDGSVTYAATAPDRPGDDDWAARITEHQKRRPAHWETAEVGAEPGRLSAVLRAATAGSVVLVDDIGGWLSAAFDAAGAWELSDPLAAVAEHIAELVASVATCPAEVVLVSPEVGLTVVPQSRAGRVFADAQGTLNQRLATTCGRTVLIVAGQPLRLDQTVTAPVTAPAAPAADPVPAVDHGAALRVAAAASVDLAAGSGGPAGDADDLLENLNISAPDWAAGEATAARLSGWVGAPGILSELAQWTGSVRGATPFNRVRCVVFAADHGDAPSGAEAARALLEGEGLLPLLAQRSGATLRLVDAGLTGEPLPGAVSAGRVRAGSDPLHQRDALTADEVEAALNLGARIADEEVDSGADLVIPAILTPSAIVPATVMIAVLCEIEPIRALGFDAYLPDVEWIRRCEQIRDGVYRVHRAAPTPRQLLAVAGGADLAAAAGFLARAASRRTPALLDGVGVAAAALLARALDSESSGWWNAPHRSGRAGEREAFAALKLKPAVELGTQLVDGAGALLTLPLVTAAADLAVTAPVAGTRAPVDPIPADADPAVDDGA